MKSILRGWGKSVFQHVVIFQQILFLDEKGKGAHVNTPTRPTFEGSSDHYFCLHLYFQSKHQLFLPRKLCGGFIGNSVRLISDRNFFNQNRISTVQFLLLNSHPHKHCMEMHNKNLVYYVIHYWEKHSYMGRYICRQLSTVKVPLKFLQLYI